jgi:hypothetical protein
VTTHTRTTPLPAPPPLSDGIRRAARALVARLRAEVPGLPEPWHTARGDGDVAVLCWCRHGAAGGCRNVELRVGAAGRVIVAAWEYGAGGGVLLEETGSGPGAAARWLAWLGEEWLTEEGRDDED